MLAHMLVCLHVWPHPFPCAPSYHPCHALVQEDEPVDFASRVLHFVSRNRISSHGKLVRAVAAVLVLVATGDASVRPGSVLCALAWHVECGERSYGRAADASPIRHVPPCCCF